MYPLVLIIKLHIVYIIATKKKKKQKLFWTTNIQEAKAKTHSGIRQDIRLPSWCWQAWLNNPGHSAQKKNINAIIHWEKKIILYKFLASCNLEMA